MGGDPTRSAGRPPVPPTLLVLASVTSVQFGGALAATLLPMVGVAGSVALRLGIACVILLAVARPPLRGHDAAAWRTLVGFGLALALMNTAFYASLERLPIGVAVTVEFLGPLALSAALSRTVRDAAAVTLAAAGVVLISGALSNDVHDLDLAGLGLALLAGVGWAAYIVMSGRAGARFPGVDGLALAMAVAAIVVSPVGVATAGSDLVGPDVLWRGIGIAVLSSVLPYSLELVALRHMDARVFGILLSLEPAVAALAGLVVLGQTLTTVQLAGMAAVIVASGAATHTEDAPAEETSTGHDGTVPSHEGRGVHAPGRTEVP